MATPTIIQYLPEVPSSDSMPHTSMDGTQLAEACSEGQTVVGDPSAAAAMQVRHAQLR